LTTINSTDVPISAKPGTMASAGSMGAGRCRYQRPLKLQNMQQPKVKSQVC
jgi:hypothetical protein